MSSTKKRVVIINHDPSLLEFLQAVLEEEGYDAISLSDRHITPSTIHALRPDLIILDIKVTDPDKDWALLDMLRLDPSTTMIPVLVTATNPHVLQAKGLQQQPNHCDVLEKPFLLDELLSKVHACLGPPT